MFQLFYDFCMQIRAFDENFAWILNDQSHERSSIEFVINNPAVCWPDRFWLRNNNPSSLAGIVVIAVPRISE